MLNLQQQIFFSHMRAAQKTVNQQKTMACHRLMRLIWHIYTSSTQRGWHSLSSFNTPFSSALLSTTPWGKISHLFCPVFTSQLLTLTFGKTWDWTKTLNWETVKCSLTKRQLCNYTINMPRKALSACDKQAVLAGIWRVGLFLFWSCLSRSTDDDVFTQLQSQMWLF